jgi:hypothetical protein
MTWPILDHRSGRSVAPGSAAVPDGCRQALARAAFDDQPRRGGVSVSARRSSAWAQLALLVAVVIISLGEAVAAAQTVPAAASKNDAPSIALGVLLFADYGYQKAPETRDSDGNLINPNSFNVARTYINVTGNVSHLVSFRVTPDIARETGTGSSLNGGLIFRLKYAYAQFNLGDWMWKDTSVRLGIQPTPYTEFIESIYRYRFQGNLWAEREGYVSTGDAGVSLRTTIPGGYGDLVVGSYNGESFAKSETNDQKAFQVRGSLRPWPTHSLLRGLQITGFYVADHYVKHAERRRGIFNVTFVHPHVNVGFDLLDARDRTSVTKPAVHGEGWSIWVTPKSAKGFEALLRHDSLSPDTSVQGRRTRTIAGIAYWFPHQGKVSSALLLDYEQARFSRIVPEQPVLERISLHAMVTF